MITHVHQVKLKSVNTEWNIEGLARKSLVEKGISVEFKM